jgi:predicted nucleotidyltransferase
LDGKIVTKESIIEFLKQNKDYLEKKYHIKKIGLFGSYARDEAREDSDIDFVIKTEKKSFRNRINLKYELEDIFKKRVDIGYISSLRSFVKKYVERDVIYV